MLFWAPYLLSSIIDWQEEKKNGHFLNSTPTSSYLPLKTVTSHCYWSMVLEQPTLFHHYMQAILFWFTEVVIHTLFLVLIFFLLIGWCQTFLPITVNPFGMTRVRYGNTKLCFLDCFEAQTLDFSRVWTKRVEKHVKKADSIACKAKGHCIFKRRSFKKKSATKVFVGITFMVLWFQFFRGTLITLQAYDVQNATQYGVKGFWMATSSV